jgi:hypothetical protein
MLMLSVLFITAITTTTSTRQMATGKRLYDNLVDQELP